MTTLTLAAIQLTSTPRIADNIATMQKLVAQAAAQGANWVLLPEYWPLMGRHDTDKLAQAEQFGRGPLQIFMAELAARHRIVLFGGSIPLLANESGKIINSLLVYGRDGQCLSRYDKAHLFSYTGIGESYREADTIEAGNRIPPSVEIDGWRYGQGVCYDLRFPEFFRAQAPFDALVLPAAFTHTTGRAHWELLLRARAGEVEQGIADWWTAFQEADEEQRKQMIQAAEQRPDSGDAPAKKRRRRRKKKTGAADKGAAE